MLLIGSRQFSLSSLQPAVQSVLSPADSSVCPLSNRYHGIAQSNSFTWVLSSYPSSFEKDESVLYDFRSLAVNSSLRLVNFS